MIPLPYIILALIAGIGIPLMASISSDLSVRLASNTAAAAVLFLGGFIVSLLLLLFNDTPSLKTFATIPSYLYTSGIFVAFYIFSMTWLGPKIGIGNAIFLVLLGQIISAATIDYIGLFNSPQTDISLNRLFGIALMIVGIFFYQKT